MKSMADLFEQVKEHIRPKKIKIDEVMRIIQQINDNLKYIDAEAVLGGSFAKETFLKGDFDVDVFVRFDPQYDDTTLSDMLEPVLKDFNPVRIHGSRDYFQFLHKGLHFEIVPVRRVEKPKEAVNVTDMSPLHVAWVKKHLKESQKDEIRLAKKFCKAAKIYGAESYINGFSGHVIDLLIIYYGSFEKLVDHASRWKDRVIIDIEDHYKEKNVMEELNGAKTISPLILVDPVQPCRNAAAALSKKQFSLFKEKAALFLDNPSQECFVETPMSLHNIKKNTSKENFFIAFEAIPVEGSKDVAGTKLYKIYEHIQKQLKHYDFGILDGDFEFNKKGVFYIIVKANKLSNTTIREGPPINAKDACKSFKEKHKNAYEKNKRLYAEVKRVYTDVMKLCKDILNSTNVISRCKKIKLV